MNDEFYHSLEYTKTLPKSIQRNKQFLQCDCGRRFSYKGGLRFHQKWECGKSLICYNCKKSFKDIGYYRNHCKLCRSRGQQSY